MIHINQDLRAEWVVDSEEGVVPRDLEQRMVGLAAVLVVGTHADTRYLDSGNSRLCMLPSTSPSPDLGTVHDNVPFPD